MYHREYCHNKNIYMYEQKSAVTVRIRGFKITEMTLLYPQKYLYTGFTGYRSTIDDTLVNTLRLLTTS